MPKSLNLEAFTTAPSRAFRFLFCLTFSAYVFTANCAEEKELTSEELSDLSIEDLLNVSVHAPAALTNLDLFETPASLTTLTAEDIERTPARNLMDLIEIYVPGAIWMTSEEGPVVGIRGSITGWNNKYLLIVNGKELNSKSLYGGVSELELWDLSDIEQVDIIRGTGSVTYGPSAVAGVIRITTHDAKSRPGFRVSAGYLAEYGSSGAGLSAGGASELADYYVYASMQRTTGSVPLQYLGSNNNQPGYVGRDVLRNQEPLDYLADYKDIPQAKIYGQLRFLKDWNLWARYTQQGAAWASNETKTDYQGKLINAEGTGDKQFSGSLDFHKDATEKLNVQAQVGTMLFDVERHLDALRGPGLDDPKNYRYNFSESEYIFGVKLDYRPRPWFETAIGSDIAREWTGPGWWDAPGDFRTGGDGIILSGPDSPIIGKEMPASRAVYAGTGWSTYTYSGYFESKFAPASLPTALLSARVDKNTQSQWLFSPRLALISPLPGRDQTLKAIIQRSEHRNESGELYIEHKNGTTPSYESLLSLELIHQMHWRKRLETAISFFYNDADLLVWDPEADRSLPDGNLKTAGGEAEAEWHLEAGHFGVSYAVMEMVDWRLAPGVTSSGISYSQYDQTLHGSTLVQTGYGQSLNNWPNQSIKAFAEFPISTAFTLHADGQLFWDYQGPQDGLAAIQAAVQGDSIQPQVDQAISRIREEGVYGPNCRINLMAVYKPTGKINVSAYVLNLLGTASNERYAFDVGNDRTSPARVRFFREDRALGFKVGLSL
ncbi:MAG: TonB-dependent receptor plug domain-containing protein [Fibrobacteres bacterium]|nr:TonB-dependent receptor plug domain-containing protein [Fibrobacterota bacterium]